MSRTVFLARLFGLYCLIVVLALVAHREAALTTMDAIVHSPDMLLVTGVLTLLGGLAMVLGHNVWSGGAGPVVVTLLGWLVLLRGAVLLFLPLDTVAAVYDALRIEQMFYVYMAVVAALGLYLTYVGFAGVSPAAPGAGLGGVAGGQASKTTA